MSSIKNREPKKRRHVEIFCRTKNGLIKLEYEIEELIELQELAACSPNWIAFDRIEIRHNLDAAYTLEQAAEETATFIQDHGWEAIGGIRANAEKSAALAVAGRNPNASLSRNGQKKRGPAREAPAPASL